MTSQGEVVGVGPGFVELRIDREQFPGLEDIYNNQSDSGRWLRRFRMVGGKCQLVDEEDNKQVNFLPELLYISEYIRWKPQPKEVRGLVSRHTD